MSNTGGALSTGTENTELTQATINNLEKDVKLGSQDPSLTIENGEVISTDDNDDSVQLLSHLEQFPIDTVNEELETQQLTFRAIFVGCVLGGVIAASNVYLGLKTGWTFGAALFGSIFGYAILKTISKFPVYLGGGYFGPKENVLCQSTATAAGSLGLLFTSGFPAAYQLGLLGKSPKDDFAKLITFTACCAYYGMFFAIPLRKFYILKQKLVFPTGVAAAQTIRTLHIGKNAEANARKKTMGMLYAFAFAITLRCVSEYAPGLLWDWHWGWTFYRLGWKWIICLENWNWIWEWTPAFIGVGMLVGINASWSFFGGSVFAWGIIGPCLVTTGKAFGEAVAPTLYPGYNSYMSMVLDDPVNKPSPRYWLVWPGTMLLLCGAFAELGANYKTIYAGIIEALKPWIKSLRRVEIDEKDLILDPAPAHEQVPWWMWSGGLVLSIFFTCLVLALQFGQNVGVSILAILFAFIFSFIGAESTGRTNITPVTAIGNASQLVVGGITRGKYPIKQQRISNLMSGMVALGASEQSADMLGDLKTAHLLRASPRVQFYGQCVGALVSIFMSVAMYVLFSEAYPCINDLSIAKCSFPAPDVGAYRAIAVAITSPTLPIPPSSGYTSIAFGIGAFAITLIKYRYVPLQYHTFVPNLVAVGIAFILNTTTYPTAMAFGATMTFLWQRNYPMAYAMYCYSIAAGFIAGEGLGGIVGAVLQVAKVSGNYYGTAVGCPAFEYCG